MLFVQFSSVLLDLANLICINEKRVASVILVGERHRLSHRPLLCSLIPACVSWFLLSNLLLQIRIATSTKIVNKSVTMMEIFPPI